MGGREGCAEEREGYVVEHVKRAVDAEEHEKSEEGEGVHEVREGYED